MTNIYIYLENIKTENFFSQFEDHLYTQNTWFKAYAV